MNVDSRMLRLRVTAGSTLRLKLFPTGCLLFSISCILLWFSAPSTPDVAGLEQGNFKQGKRLRTFDTMLLAWCMRGTSE